MAREGRAITLADLRMGLEPDYVFRFKIAEMGNPPVVATGPERLAAPWNLARLRWVGERIWITAAETARSLTGGQDAQKTWPAVAPEPPHSLSPNGLVTAR